MIRVVILLFLLPAIALARDGSQLSAFAAYTDLRLGSIERGLEVISSTREAKSGKWSEVKGLLEGYEKSEHGLALWYMLPDGRYYTVDKGLMEARLSDRDYFPDLVSGRKVIGPLVVSKSTGRRSAVMPCRSGRAEKRSVRSAPRFFSIRWPSRSGRPFPWARAPPFSLSFRTEGRRCTARLTAISWIPGNWAAKP